MVMGTGVAWHLIANAEALRGEEVLPTSPRVVVSLGAVRASFSRGLAENPDDCFGNGAACIVQAMWKRNTREEPSTIIMEIACKDGAKRGKYGMMARANDNESPAVL